MHENLIVLQKLYFRVKGGASQNPLWVYSCCSLQWSVKVRPPKLKDVSCPDIVWRDEGQCRIFTQTIALSNHNFPLCHLTVHYHLTCWVIQVNNSDNLWCQDCSLLVCLWLHIGTMCAAIITASGKTACWLRTANFVHFKLNWMLIQHCTRVY